MAEDQAPAVRQRKKRKWDQPAEALVAPAIALPLSGMMQFGGTNPLAAFGMPNMMTMMSSYMTLPTAAATIPVASPLTSTSPAAAIVQKINQELVAKGLVLPSKVHDEVISREIVINDADPGVRYKLTKRQTQEEIQAKTGAVVITRGRFRPLNGPPDMEKPLYLHISAGVQLKDTAERIKAVDAATALVEEMMRQGPPSAGALQSGGGGPSFSAIVNVGMEADPSFNLIGRIRGPNDQYIKHIMTETGAEVVIRGRGSGYNDPSTGEELQQPLHLFISSENAKSLDDARKLTENLLDTIRTDYNSFRPGPPQPMANGSSSMYSHGGAPHVPRYGYQQSSSVYSTQVGSQNPRVQFQTSGFLSGSQPEIVGSLSQAAAPPRNLMDPYANMRPPSKSFAAVPPPKQLLVGAASDATTTTSIRSGLDSRLGAQEALEPPTTSTTVRNIVSVESSAAHPPGVASPGPYQSLVNANQQNTSPYYQPAGAVPYSNPAYVQASTYAGYGGVYPQASPLQQVATALQRPPLPLSVRPGLVPPGTEVASQSTRQPETPSSGPVQKERRKFQEFVAAKSVASDVSQVCLFSLPSGLTQAAPSFWTHLSMFHRNVGEVSRLGGVDCEGGGQVHQVTGSAKQDAIGSSANVKMPPPPPKFIPPPPKFTSSVGNMPPPKPASVPPEKGASELEQESKGLKLVEYGEEDDDDEENVVDNTKAVNSHPSLHPNGRPFWAAP